MIPAVDRQARADAHLGAPARAPGLVLISISITVTSVQAPLDAAGDERRLFRAWHRVVDPDDTVGFLGDVTIRGLSGRRLKRLRAAPGRKVLVPGNHEFDATVAGHVEVSTRSYSTLYVLGSPELLSLWHF